MISSSDDGFPLPSETSMLESDGVVSVSLLWECTGILQPQKEISLMSLDVQDVDKVEHVDLFL